MSEYFKNLLACYKSGQVSERQWQEHLKDEKLKEWLKDEKIKRQF